MAVEFISDVVVTSSADAGSQAVTVPADADACVIGIGGWKNATMFPPTTLTLGGQAFTALQSQNNNANEKGFLGRLVAPPTGSQTFAWDIGGSGAITEGLVYIIAFLKNVDDTSPVVASGQSTGNTDVTGLGSPAAGDMMVGFSASFDAAAIVTNSGQTSLSTPARFNLAFLRGAWKAGANAYDITAAGDIDFNSHFAVVLRAVGAAGVSGDAATVAPPQTSAASGSVTVEGSAATAAAAQTSGATGEAIVTGAAATQAAVQTSAATGQVVVTGAAATSALAQTSAAAGTVGAIGASATAAAAQSTQAVGDAGDGEALEVTVPLDAMRDDIAVMAGSRVAVAAMSGQRTQAELQGQRDGTAALAARRESIAKAGGKAN